MATTISIDNTTDKDNFIINRSGVPASVSCSEMFGSFSFDLQPGEFKRITFNVEANVYPLGQYSYDNLKYSLGQGKKWEIRFMSGSLVLMEVDMVSLNVQQEEAGLVSSSGDVTPAHTKVTVSEFVKSDGVIHQLLLQIQLLRKNRKKAVDSFLGSMSTQQKLDFLTGEITFPNEVATLTQQEVELCRKAASRISETSEGLQEQAIIDWLKSDEELDSVLSNLPYKQEQAPQTVTSTPEVTPGHFVGFVFFSITGILGVVCGIVFFDNTFGGYFGLLMACGILALGVLLFWQIWRSSKKKNTAITLAAIVIVIIMILSVFFIPLLV